MPNEVLAALLTAGLGLQAWILIEIVKLKTEVAVLRQRMDDAKL